MSVCVCDSAWSYLLIRCARYKCYLLFIIIIYCPLDDDDDDDDVDDDNDDGGDDDDDDDNDDDDDDDDDGDGDGDGDDYDDDVVLYSAVTSCSVCSAEDVQSFEARLQNGRFIVYVRTTRLVTLPYR